MKDCNRATDKLVFIGVFKKVLEITREGPRVEAFGFSLMLRFALTSKLKDVLIFIQFIDDPSEVL
jgi:hypothetical protein